MALSVVKKAISPLDHTIAYAFNAIATFEMSVEMGYNCRQGGENVTQAKYGSSIRLI
jgi:hypothetical protein